MFTSRMYSSCFSSTSPTCCSQANDTFAGDHLLQSFQRLGMILANTSGDLEPYQGGTTFGEASKDTLVAFETGYFQSSQCTQCSMHAPISLTSLIISCNVMLFIALLFSLFLFILQNWKLCPIWLQFLLHCLVLWWAWLELQRVAPWWLRQWPTSLPCSLLCGPGALVYNVHAVLPW